MPPKAFVKGLRRLCNQYGVLLCADEVQSGCYRTGKFMAMENFGVKADIVSMSKAIGGGMPLGATISSNKIMDWPPGAHANTFGGNLIACAAGIATLDQMKSKKLGANIDFQFLDFNKPFNFPDNTFDLCTSAFAIYYASDLGFTFGEAHRVLQPGGRLFVSAVDRIAAGVHKSLRPGQHHPLAADIADAGAGVPLLAVEADALRPGQVADTHETDVVAVAGV